MNANVAKRIRELRQERGISIRQLSALSGITPSQISLIEREKNSPTVSTLQKIVTALDTDLPHFFVQDN